jgi:hypothetical protein
MFCTPTETKTAKKNHRCTYCGDPIYAGDTYKAWTSFDGYAFNSKMHPECLNDLRETNDPYDDGEYNPYDNDRPQNSDVFFNMVKFLCYHID